MAIPSSTAMVLNSKGTPPASRMHFFTCSPTRFRWTWPGTISTKELHTAMNGLPMSASVTPQAFSRLRWGARSNPFFTMSDRIGKPPMRNAFRDEPAYRIPQIRADRTPASG